MARQSIFKFNERVTTEAKDATYEFRGPVISVRNLEKKFGEHEVLKDISFDLFEGDVVCIIGSSGSGKSTLLRCINHLETPTSGHLRCFLHGSDSPYFWYAFSLQQKISPCKPHEDKIWRRRHRAVTPLPLFPVIPQSLRQRSA